MRVHAERRLLILLSSQFHYRQPIAGRVGALGLGEPCCALTVAACASHPGMLTSNRISSHLIISAHISSHLLTDAHMCSELHTWVHIYLHLFTVVPICSQLFTSAHICSYLLDWARWPNRYSTGLACRRSWVQTPIESNQ